MPASDTKYLQDLVGDALARGAASCISENPNDPVDFLGNWLLRYVRNALVEGQLYEQQEMENQAKKLLLEEEKAAAIKNREAEGEKKAAIAELSVLEAEPRELIQHAVDLIKKFTAAGGAYAAAVADVEEPDWTPPEDPEDPAAVESEDEADPPPPAPDVEGEGASVDGESAPDATQDLPPEVPVEGEPVAKPQRPVDYSKKYLSYIAASSGQEFMCTSELRRPAPPPEDAGEDFKPEPVPYTFRILDERMPMVLTPNVPFEPSIKFIGDFPKIGSYQACGIQIPSAGGEYKAIIAADTLFPEGSGQPLSQEDQDFIWEVSLALSKAYEAVDTKFKESQAASNLKDFMAELNTKIQLAYHPPPPEPIEGEDSDSAAPAPAASEPAAEGEAPAPEVDEAPPPEGEGADPLLLLSYEIKKLNKDFEVSSAAQEAASKSLESAQQAMTVIKGAIKEISERAVLGLRTISAVPQATFHIIKAVLYLLGKDPETFQNWKRAFEHFTMSLFEELSSYDATQDRNLDTWNQIRKAYKGVKDPASFVVEMPDTHLGVLLSIYIKQVRKVGRRAATFRAHSQTTEQLTEQLAKKRVELEEAEARKAAEEEAARLAAEEEAARLAAEEAAAAAAAAEGEEGAAEGAEGAE